MAASFRPRPLPISADEFARMFQVCMPPTGWRSNVGVANSGGPDSTCLLFLMRRHLLSLPPQSLEQPLKTLYSFHVDHALQSCSAEMAEKTKQIAKNMEIEHRSTRIPWGDREYPPQPAPGGPIETLARDARYWALFQMLLGAKTNVVALGHHADDQLETSLMRLGRGTTVLGARGILPCRRWGMGTGTKETGLFGFMGKEGMRRWIIRPLLSVSKDRILATCEENGLEYVTDPTNFQPELTLRNALRQRIETQDEELSAKHSEALPPQLRQGLEGIDKGLQEMSPVPITLDSGKGQLHSVLRQIIEDADDIDTRVDGLLARSRAPSPPGTFLISQQAIMSVKDPLIRRAYILRILRYTSFFPWGSLRSDANRRSQSLNQIIDRLWDPKSLDQPRERFIAGGGVLWTPVLHNGDGQIRHAVGLSEEPKDDGWSFGWIASRQPPFSKRNPDHNEHLRAATVADPTDHILRMLKTSLGTKVSNAQFEYLWDCRYLITFDLKKIPNTLRLALLLGSTRIEIHPYTEWTLPMVVKKGQAREPLFMPVLDQRTPMDKIMKKLSKSVPGQAKPYPQEENPLTSEWITIDFMRALDSI